MTWRGTAYRLPPSAPRTAVTGFSPLLPTPVAADGREKGGGGRWSPTSAPLEQTVKLLPTPNASLCNYEEQPETWEPRRAAAAERHGNNGIGMPLPIALKLLPTPTTQTGGDGERPDGFRCLLEPELRRVESQSSGATTSPPSGAGKPSTGLRLSPSFVEWMMGAPARGDCGRGWTDPDCPHSVTAFTSMSAGSSARP
jgi:hypothetical protein